MRLRVCLLPAFLILTGCAAGERSKNAGVATSVDATQAKQGEADQPHETPRRIIYRATVKLVVTNFADTEQAVPKLVEQFGGYLAEAAVERREGVARSGRWVCRTPVDRFDEFLGAVGELGVPESTMQTADDVTAEFVDLEARISTKKKLEERLIDLLAREGDKLQHVIEVERELARVRSEIEQMEGRRRLLAHQTDLATVTIHAREVRDYVPPQAPTLSGRLAAAWSASLENLRTLAADCLVAVVAAGPWLLIALGLALPAIAIWRRRRKRLAQAAN